MTWDSLISGVYFGNSQDTRGGQGGRKKVRYHQKSPYHHGICRIFIPCGKKTHARKSAQGFSFQIRQFRAMERSSHFLVQKSNHFGSFKGATCNQERGFEWKRLPGDLCGSEVFLLWSITCFCSNRVGREPTQSRMMRLSLLLVGVCTRLGRPCFSNWIRKHFFYKMKIIHTTCHCLGMSRWKPLIYKMKGLQ